MVGGIFTHLYTIFTHLYTVFTHLYTVFRYFDHQRPNKNEQIIIKKHGLYYIRRLHSFADMTP